MLIMSLRVELEHYNLDIDFTTGAQTRGYFDVYNPKSDAETFAK